MASGSTPDLANSSADLLAQHQPAAVDEHAGAELLVLVRVGRDGQVHRAVVAVGVVAARAAEGGEPGRPRRHEHVAVGHALAVAGHVQRPAAAVAEQRVVDGRVALAQDLGHGLVAQGLVEELDHARGRLLDPEPERPRDLLLDGRAGTVGVQGHVAAEEVVGVDAAEDQVEVGDASGPRGRRRPSTRRSWRRPSRARARAGPSWGRCARTSPSRRRSSRPGPAAG